MNNKSILAASILLICLAQGCATKTYGRQGELTDFEKNTMSCRDIDLDLARTHGFKDHVHKESQFSGKDVLAVLGDFGIGNSMEKSAALESADKRIADLEALKTARNCPPTSN